MNDNKVLHFFEEISKIPRESGDEKAVSDYLVAFAKERSLEVYQDEVYNVIIKKPATVKTDCPPVIIQGHTDMVYVKAPDCKRDYSEGIGLIYKDGFLYADGTTLGADDGIAVAYALALLDSDDLPHPDIEAVFTVSEETGLIGAQKLDCSRLKGKYLLNLDTEEEGIFCTSCAGAFRNELFVPLSFEKRDGMQELSLSLGGLSGGHSGVEIHVGHGNGIVLMGRVLSALGDKVAVGAVTAEGKMNAICNNAAARLFCRPEDLSAVEATVLDMEAKFVHELGDRDSVFLKLEKGSVCTAECYTEQTPQRVLAALSLIPNGVLAMSFDIEGLVETSANPGIVEQGENELMILSSCRSSVGSRKEEMRQKYLALAALCGGRSEFSGDYPMWEYKADSPLRTLAMETYKELFGKEIVTMAIHAGLECGHFAEKLPDTDIITYGPNLYDIHTPKERANLESVERTWLLTKEILKRLAEQK